MLELIEANWPLLLASALIGLLIAWYVFHASRKTTVRSDRGDVLDEGASPAARNQALIDSAPSASADTVIPPATPPGIAGAGEAVSAAVEAQQVEAKKVEAQPVAETVAPEPVAAAPAPIGEADDLTRIKGVGPKLAKILGELGITSFSQIAKWDDAEIKRIDAQLGRFQGRIERDNWVEQAGFLSSGDLDGYKAKFGNME